MREILFRGKNEDGEWVYGSHVPYELRCSGDYDHLTCFNNTQRLHTIICHPSKDELQYGDSEPFNDYFQLVLPETVGQYTNRVDSNNKKVFQGDKVIFVNCSGEQADCEGIIIFDRGRIPCMTIKGGYADGSDFRRVLDTIPVLHLVIGNIHDNPELLEGKS